MANRIYQDRFVLSISSALEDARNASVVDHPGLVGRYRELLVEKILQPLIGSDFGFGSGKIVDSLGNSSREIDLIIYQRNSIPPVLWSGREGIFPIEACCYAIEVKSRLTNAALRYAVSGARSLLSLKERRVSLGDESKPASLPIALFAYDAQMTKMIQVVNVLEEVDPDWQTNPALMVICAASLGYMGFDGTVGEWIGTHASEKNEHIVTFAIGVANTLLRWPISRDLALGPYLIDNTYASGEMVTFS